MKPWPRWRGRGVEVVTRMAGAFGLVVLVAVSPAVGHAQAVSSFDRLARLVRTGDRIAVTLREETAAGQLPCHRRGEELQGRLSGLSSTTLTIRHPPTPMVTLRRPPAVTVVVRGQSTMQSDWTADEVCLLRRRHRDSILNGAVIGGASAGVFWTAFQEKNAGELTGSTVALLTGCGVLVGMGIDALFQGGWETVYRAPDYGTARRVRVAPVVVGKKHGLAMTLRF